MSILLLTQHIVFTIAHTEWYAHNQFVELNCITISPTPIYSYIEQRFTTTQKLFQTRILCKFNMHVMQQRITKEFILKQNLFTIV